MFPQLPYFQLHMDYLHNQYLVNEQEHFSLSYTDGGMVNTIPITFYYNYDYDNQCINLLNILSGDNVSL